MMTLTLRVRGRNRPETVSDSKRFLSPETLGVKQNLMRIREIFRYLVSYLKNFKTSF
uniref:Uncharacterized protein n=1 Tax=Anguilla anguilla TaxID=7936 RepID=A0A0E9R9U3_ANGAN